MKLGNGHIGVYYTVLTTSVSVLKIVNGNGKKKIKSLISKNLNKTRHFLEIDFLFQTAN